MAKITHYTKWMVNIILGFGCFLVFNENEHNLTPNLIGLACVALLIAINKDNNQ